MARLTKRTDDPKPSSVRLIVLGKTAARQVKKLLAGVANLPAIETVETLLALEENLPTKSILMIPVACARSALRQKLQTGLSAGDALNSYIEETQTLLRTAVKFRRSMILVDAEMLKSGDLGLLDALVQRLGLQLTELSTPVAAATPKRAKPDLLDLLAQSLLAASPDATSLFNELKTVCLGPLGSSEMTMQNLESAFSDWQSLRDAAQDDGKYEAALKEAADTRSALLALEAEMAPVHNLALERDLLRAQTARLMAEAESNARALEDLRHELAAAQSLVHERNLLRVQTAKLLDDADDARLTLDAIAAREIRIESQASLLRENSTLLSTQLSEQLCRQHNATRASDLHNDSLVATQRSLVDQLAKAEVELAAQTKAAGALRGLVALLEQNNAQLLAHLDHLRAPGSWRISEAALHRAPGPQADGQ